MLTKNLLAITSITAVGASIMSGSAEAAGFANVYDPANWTFTNTNTNGSVDTSGAPSAISITGGDNGDNGLFLPGSTTYITTASEAGLVSFDWAYTTLDTPSFDPFGYLLNGVFTELTDMTQAGSANFSVLVGDTFGFSVNTLDNFGGSATATISNFQAPVASTPQPVPEPLTILGSLAALGLGGAMKQKFSA